MVNGDGFIQTRKGRNSKLEVVSKPYIRFKGPAKRNYISELKRLRYASSVRPIGKGVVLSIHGYVSIYRRSATQPLGLRLGFEATSILSTTITQDKLISVVFKSSKCLCP